MKTAIILTVINCILLVANLVILFRRKNAGVDQNKYSLPEYTDDGEGVVIKSKNGKPVITFKKEFK